MQAGPLFQSFHDAWRRLRPTRLTGNAFGGRTSLYEIIHYCYSPPDIETSIYPPAVSNTANKNLLDYLHIQ